MVQCASGGIVSVLADGRALQEYGIKEVSDDKAKMYECCEYEVHSSKLELNP